MAAVGRVFLHSKNRVNIPLRTRIHPQDLVEAQAVSGGIQRLDGVLHLQCRKTTLGRMGLLILRLVGQNPVEMHETGGFICHPEAELGVVFRQQVEKQHHLLFENVRHSFRNGQLPG